MAELHVDIVTPSSLVFSGTATELVAPLWNGEADLLPGHALYLSLLRGGVLTVVGERGSERFVVGRGFVEAGPERVTVLTESCTPADQVDKAQAQQELKDLEHEMLTVNGFDSSAFDKVEERRERAQAVVELP
ncbi:MAG: ATP synthase F1 subunit epsilon [Deltaproteobacteria bacterium]|nr:MAG: ATP synthase F1 subunit epsilon [Deltaproteobacteria bacterium]